MRSILLAATIGAMPVLAAADVLARSPACPVGATGTSAGPGTRTPIPLPDRALMAPPPQFDCAFKAAGPDSASGEPQNPPRSQADSGTDAALRRKLDYERQCYRHAEMILRERLLLLQAPAGETIKAAAMCGAASKGLSARARAKSAIPLPDRALLAPPPEFACELKPGGTSGQAPPSPPPAEAGTDARKLEHERQCYRHAEMILRDRLLQLQASLGETITAVSRSEQPAMKQPRPGTVGRGGEPAITPSRLGDRNLARALRAGGYVIVHRYTGRMPGSSPAALADTIDSGQRVSPQGRVSAQAMGNVYRRLGIPVSQVISSEYFLVYQTATAAFGDRVRLHRDLSGTRSFNDPAELERSLAGLRSRVATPPPAGTNVVLWTHEGKFMKAFGRPLPAGATAVFDPRNGREVARLSLREFLALASEPESAGR